MTEQKEKALEKGTYLIEDIDFDKAESYPGSVKKFFEDNSIDPDEKNCRNETRLHIAAMTGLTRATRVLIEAGADVNARNVFGNTALHIAAFFGRDCIVKQLIKSGADVNAEDEYKSTPLHEASFAASLSVMKLLLDAGADINAEDESGHTPLYSSRLCFTMRWKEAEAFLLASGAR